MAHSIKQLLDNGELVRVFSMGALTSHKLIEIAAQLGGFHGLWIDQEHSAVSHAQMEILLLACRATGLDAFSRVPPTDYATIMRPMEVGCSGVMIAQVRTMDEVHQAVEWSKYPPLGVRGLFMGNAESGYGTKPPAEHVSRANAERWLAVQIETVEAVELADEIAACDGVDLLFVGPGDLACTLGVPGEALHPKCVDALQRVSHACAKSGTPWGTLTRSAEHAAKCRELGCQLFSVVSDIDIILRGMAASQEIFAGLA